MRNDSPAADSIPQRLHGERHRLRLLAVSALMALAAVSAGCASRQAPADSGLNGSWRLDGAVSDNVEARVKQAIDHAEARQRKRMRAAYGAGGGLRNQSAGEAGDEEQFAATPVLGPDFAQLRDHLLQILTAPRSLSLEVQPDSVTIQSDHLPSRTYQPGESFVRFDEYGSASVGSGWSGNAFFVRQRYMGRGALTERYEIDPKSGALAYTRALKDPTVGAIELKSIYHRP